MRLMIDTNIFLDVLARWEPFYAASRAVLELCEKKAVKGFLSASSVTDLFYLMRRQLHSAEAAYEALGYVLDIAGVLAVTGEDVMKAYLKRTPDFEDCLVAMCAASCGCEGIVTRNGGDFAALGMPVWTPEDVIARFQ